LENNSELFEWGEVQVMRCLLRMLRLTQVSLRGVLALASFIALQPGLARSDAKSPYCWPEERFAPNGRIVELGGRFFHLCGAPGDGFPYNNDPQADYRHVAIGPKGSKASEVEAETDAPSFLWGQMEYHENWYSTTLANKKRQFPKRIGDIRLGSADYQIWVNGRIFRNHPGSAEKGNIPDHALYVFDRPEGSDIPDHRLICRGDPTVEPRERYHCNIYLKYRESNSFIVDHRLMWSSIFEGGPMDFDRLPDLVRAVHALFDHVDVTDRLDTREGVPIVRAPE
jgi:hypothetical protein